MTSNPSYEVDYDERGEIAQVRRLDAPDEKPNIPLNVHDPKFCEFLTWGWNSGKVSIPCDQLNPLSPAREHRVEFFCRSQDVIGYCKQNSATLTTTGNLPYELDWRPAIHLKCAARADEGRHPVPLFLEIATLRRFFRRDRRGAFETIHSISPDPKSPSIFVTESVITEFNMALSTDVDSELQAVCYFPVERTFVYFDISAFSKENVPSQLQIINSLIGLADNDDLWPGSGRDPRVDWEASLCIGDGYIYVFKTPWNAAHFAAYLAALIEHRFALAKIPEFHFRAGVHTGTVYRFWDRFGPLRKSSDGRWNYTGTGIIEAERVLTAIGKQQDDVVFISAETRRRIQANISQSLELEIDGWLQNRGRRADKHKGYRRLYEVNHVGWMKHQHSLRFTD